MGPHDMLSVQEIGNENIKSKNFKYLKKCYNSFIRDDFLRTFGAFYDKSTMNDPILNKMLQIDKSDVQETKNSEINYKHYELVTYMKNIIIWADAKMNYVNHDDATPGITAKIHEVSKSVVNNTLHMDTLTVNIESDDISKNDNKVVLNNSPEANLNTLSKSVVNTPCIMDTLMENIDSEHISNNKKEENINSVIISGIQEKASMSKSSNNNVKLNPVKSNCGSSNSENIPCIIDIPMEHIDSEDLSSNINEINIHSIIINDVQEMTSVSGSSKDTVIVDIEENLNPVSSTYDNLCLKTSAVMNLKPSVSHAVENTINDMENLNPVSSTYDNLCLKTSAVMNLKPSVSHAVENTINDMDKLNVPLTCDNLCLKTSHVNNLSNIEPKSHKRPRRTLSIALTRERNKSTPTNSEKISTVKKIEQPSVSHAVENTINDMEKLNPVPLTCDNLCLKSSPVSNLSNIEPKSQKKSRQTLSNAFTRERNNSATTKSEKISTMKKIEQPSVSHAVENTINDMEKLNPVPFTCDNLCLKTSHVSNLSNIEPKIHKGSRRTLSNAFTRKRNISAPIDSENFSKIKKIKQPTVNYAVENTINDMEKLNPVPSTCNNLCLESSSVNSPSNIEPKTHKRSRRTLSNALTKEVNSSASMNSEKISTMKKIKQPSVSHAVENTINENMEKLNPVPSTCNNSCLETSSVNNLSNIELKSHKRSRQTLTKAFTRERNNSAPINSEKISSMKKIEQPSVSHAIENTTNDVSNSVNTSNYSAKKAGKHMYSRNSKGETQLHVACAKGKLDLVMSLLGNSFNPNVKDNAGWTPLHEAVKNGHNCIVKKLIDHGAYLNAPGFEYESPLYTAMKYNRFDIATTLFQNGAYTQCTNMYGVNAKSINEEKWSQLIKNPILFTPSEMKYVYELDQIIIFLYKVSLKRADVDKFCKQFNINEKELVQATHIIVPESENNTCGVNLECLTGIANGLFIVNQRWISDSLEQHKLLNCENYEVGGTTTFVDCDGPKISRLNKQNLYPKLFDGINVHISGNIGWEHFSSEQLKKLVLEFGAKLLKRMPNPEDSPTDISPYHCRKNKDMYHVSTIILYTIDSNRLIKYNMEHLKTFHISWFMEIVQKYSIT